MKRSKIAISAVVFAVVSAGMMYADSGPGYKYGPFEFLLPTDLEKNPKMLFSALIPSKFKWAAGINDVGIGIGDGVTLEYIPEGETLEDWSEIITLEISSKIPHTLLFLVWKVKSLYEEEFPKEKVKFSLLSHSEENGMEVAVFSSDIPASHAISRKLIPGQRENVLHKIVQRKGGIRQSVQYCVRYLNGPLPKELQEKQQKFIENCKLLTPEECGIKSGVQAK